MANSLVSIVGIIVQLYICMHLRNYMFYFQGPLTPFLKRQFIADNKAQSTSSVGVAKPSSFAFLRGPATTDGLYQ